MASTVGVWNFTLLLIVLFVSSVFSDARAYYNYQKGDNQAFVSLGRRDADFVSAGPGVSVSGDVDTPKTTSTLSSTTSPVSQASSPAWNASFTDDDNEDDDSTTTGDTSDDSGLNSTLASLTPVELNRIGGTDQRYSIKLGLLEGFADPSVVRAHGVYYAFATNKAGINVQVATSLNFRKWHLKTGWDALPTTGEWTQQSHPMVWAPDVFVNDDGKFVMTYSATLKGQDRHCVGTAVSENPWGPFIPNPDPFACHIDQGGAIDSSGFRDPQTNNLYIVYKIDGNTRGHGGICNNMARPQHPTPIMLQRVAGDGVTKLGSPIQIFDRVAQDGPLVEAPNLHYDAASRRYVLFYSSGCYADPVYDTGYVFSTGSSVLGPYVRQSPARRPAQLGGTPSQRLLKQGLSGLHSPGGASVIRAHHGKVGMVFHAYTSPKGRRSLFTAWIQVDAANQRVTAWS